MDTSSSPIDPGRASRGTKPPSRAMPPRDRLVGDGRIRPRAASAAMKQPAMTVPAPAQVDIPAFRTIPAGAALYMAVVQFLFVTSWTTYVIYLPQLLATAGLPARYTPWVLLIDQLVFM